MTVSSIYRVDLKKVRVIPQKHKDIVNGYIRKVQSPLSQDNSYFNIVDLIKHIILLYYHCLFKSNILDMDDQHQFINLLMDNNKTITNHSWELIYDSTKDGLDVNGFANKVHNKSNILLFFWLNKECIIGGYTKTGWDDSIKHYNWAHDKEAFVFYLKSPKNYKPFISNVKQDDHSVSKAIGYTYRDMNIFGIFGEYWLLYCMDGTFQECSNFEENNYEMFEHGSELLSGAESVHRPQISIYNQTVPNIEAFQMVMDS